MGDFELEIEGPDLASYQKDILYCEQRFTITEASTKIGKTFSHSWWLFERAHADWNEPGYNHWWVAPVYGQAEIAFKRMKALLDLAVYKINETKLTITTPLGTVMAFKSADNPDNLFGEDVYSCVFDEAPRASYEAFVALRSTLTATKGPLKLIGNFGGSANWVHQLKQKAVTDPKNWAYFKVTAYDAVKEGILDAEEVEQAREDLPPKVFKQLYMAEEQESDDMLVTYDNINDLWTNDHVRGVHRYMTCDIALHGSDKFVLYVWEGWRIIHSKVFDKCEANDVELIIKSTATRFGVSRSRIAYDADGLGTFLRGYLRGAKPFNNGASPLPQVGRRTKINFKNLKSQCGYELARIIRAGKMAISDANLDAGKIKSELECLRSHALDQEGKVQLLPKKEIKKLIGHSPDYLDAMIIRAYFELMPKPRQAKATLA